MRLRIGYPPLADEAKMLIEQTGEPRSSGSSR